jgi:hypothetical protein
MITFITHDPIKVRPQYKQLQIKMVVNIGINNHLNNNSKSLKMFELWLIMQNLKQLTEYS